MVCDKWMRSDNYDRHMKIHKDILTLPDDEIEVELKARQVWKLAKEEREEKRQQIVKTASKLNVSVPEELKDHSLEELHQRLLKNKSI